MRKDDGLFRGKVDDSWEYYSLDSRFVPNVELDQWTGYEDSNHIKIFEGDIVEITTNDGDSILYFIWYEKEGQERWAYLLKNFNHKYEAKNFKIFTYKK